MPTTDAVKLLKDDHKQVKELFREYEGLGERAHAKKGKLAREIIIQLTAHAKIEEEIFYPTVQQRVKALKDVVLEGEEEHHVAERLMNELQGMDPSDEHFDPKMKVLIESVEHHIKEEEKEMLPDAKEKLGNETSALGEQMARRKEELLAELAGMPEFGRPSKGAESTEAAS